MIIMAQITVNLVEMHALMGDHVEIILTETRGNEVFYYSIWVPPAAEPTVNDPSCQIVLTRANRTLSFSIEADMQEIIDAWQSKLSTEYCFSICYNNCADIVRWFLEAFADIKLPGNCSRPVTYDYVTLLCSLPSCLWCCTSPSRTFDLAEEALKERDSKQLPLLAKMERR